MDDSRTRRLALGGIAVVLVLALPAALAIPAAQARNQKKPDPVPGISQAPRPDAADLDAVARIKDEGLQRSQVMDTLWYLTDVHGPRLTNSPAIRAAAAWAEGRLRDWASGTCARRPGGR